MGERWRRSIMASVTMVVWLFCGGWDRIFAQTPQPPSVSSSRDLDCIYLGRAITVIEDKRKWHVPLTDKDAEEERLWQTGCRAYHPSPEEQMCRQLAELVGQFAQGRAQGVRLQEALGILRQSVAAAPGVPPALMERLKTLMTKAVMDLYANPLLPARQAEDIFEAQCLTTKPASHGYWR